VVSSTSWDADLHPATFLNSSASHFPSLHPQNHHRRPIDTPRLTCKQTNTTQLWMYGFILPRLRRDGTQCTNGRVLGLLLLLVRHRRLVGCVQCPHILLFATLLTNSLSYSSRPAHRVPDHDRRAAISRSARGIKYDHPRLFKAEHAWLTKRTSSRSLLLTRARPRPPHSWRVERAAHGLRTVV
jgi:hypothetical protein